LVNISSMNKKNRDFRYGGRFSRAWLQSPRHYVPAGPSAHAIPAEVAALRFNQLVL
jgi:hypothetical protein